MQKWKTTFAIIYAGQAFSIVGSSAVQFAVIWWLTVLTGSAITLTMATIVSFLPGLLIGPFAGVWIDRHNRRITMMLADGFVALSTVVLAVAFLITPTPPLWFIYVILFARGVGSTFHSPAMQAAIPTLVPAEMLTKAGGWGNMINSLSYIAGPALGALLIATIPMAGIMLFDIGGAVFAIGSLLFVRIPDIEQTVETPHIFTDMKRGFSAMRGNRPLMTLFIPSVVFTVLYMPLSALFPLMVFKYFGGTAWHNSLVEVAFAGGLLAVSLIMGIWGGTRRRFLMISASHLIIGLATAFSGLLPPGGFIIFVVLSFIMGGSGTLFNVPFTAYMQETIAPDVMGKVFAFMFTAMSAAMPVGLVLAGPLSEHIGVHNWFLLSGIAMLINGIYCLAATRKYDRQPAPEALESES